jgi:hypothetical protein
MSRAMQNPRLQKPRVFASVAKPYHIQPSVFFPSPAKSEERDSSPLRSKPNVESD